MNDKGELEVETGLGVVKFTKPVAYQEEDGKSKCVEVAYTVVGDRYGVKMGDYDKGKELVIELFLASTYVGGKSNDYIKGIAIDSGDNVFVTGRTLFPVFSKAESKTDAIERVQGCCSWHGGVCGCSNRRQRCCDGTLSPSCTCFSQPSYYTLTVSKTGNGTVTSSPSGISCGSDCTESYTSGTSVTLTAAPATGWSFGSWSGCGSVSGATCYVTMNSSKTAIATFTQISYTFTVSKSGSGTVTSAPAGISYGSDCMEGYASNTSVTLTATPASGWGLSSWSGCDSSSGATCYVTINSNRAVTATFTRLTYTLTVSKSGSGTVTSSPAGISCGADCSESYNSGTSVTLTATPASGWSFSSWSGCDSSSGATCNVTMTSSRTVTATFTQLIYTLTVSKSGSGAVASAPAGISCGADCTEEYTSGTSVTLTATPGSGWSFAGWSGCDSSSGATCYVTISSNTTVTAAFTPIYTLTVSKSGSGAVASAPAGISCGADCTEEYTSGTSVTLTATPGSGWSFAGWSGCDSASGSTCPITMSSDRAVTAIFATYSPDVTVTNISPQLGTTAGGCPVTVEGSGFQSGALLIMGSNLASQTSVASDTLITAVTPRAHGIAPVGSPPSVQEVVVANPDGGSASAQLFTYVRPGDIRMGAVYGEHDGNVTIGEVIYIVNVLLRKPGFEVKPEADSNCNGTITIGEVIQAVNSLLRKW